MKNETVIDFAPLVVALGASFAASAVACAAFTALSDQSGRRWQAS
jgi:hypothetical protein